MYSAASLTKFVGILLGLLAFPGFKFLRYCNTCASLTGWNLILTDGTFLLCLRWTSEGKIFICAASFGPMVVEVMICCFSYTTISSYFLSGYI